MNDFDETIERMLQQERILLSVLAQAKAKLETSQDEAEINRYERFIEDGLALIKEVEDKLYEVFGKGRSTGTGNIGKGRSTGDSRDA